MKEKICCVVQRYGLEVNGGAELHCRQLAERLVPFYDVEVLTTKAIDYMTWKDEYKQSEEMIHGVKVRRFSVSKERNIAEFNQINDKFMQGNLAQKDEQKWMDAQGPYVPELIQYISKHKDDYKVFIFFTYLYYQTAMGIRVVKEKSIVVPDAHDEPFLKMKIFDPVFKSPKAMLFNTEDECMLVRKKYKNWDVKYRIGGAGVDLPNDINGQRFKDKYKLDKYMVYVGRIDEGKNCSQLFRDFITYKKLYPSNLKLILMGKSVIQIPQHPDIISLGFVDDQDKFDGICGSDFLVLPSKFESLSIVVLEAFSLGIPVLVNGVCDVLKSHCTKSNAGLYYKRPAEFCEAVQFLEEHPDVREAMGVLGKAYVEQYYQWDVVIKKFCELIDFVIQSNEFKER